MKDCCPRALPVGLLLAELAAVLLPAAAGGQQQRPPESAGASWSVLVVDGRSGTPLEGARVVFPDYEVVHFTSDLGVVPGQGRRPSTRLTVTRLGYADLKVTVAVPSTGGEAVTVEMERAAIALPPLTVASERQMTSRELHRLIFDREVAVGAIGVTRTEIQDVPPVGEPDVFRSLQAFAGVSSVNDMTGQLFVRGGAADQVATMVDGAPVFGPYHMLGLFGTFNPDAVESVEFYRGSIPARYGGSLSGILSAKHRVGGSGGTRVRGGLSLLGLRVAADGALPWGGARWLAAARRASVDVAGLDVPYSFQDMNLGVEIHPGEEHRLRLSAFASTDDFEWDSHGPAAFGSFSSEWSNVASSLSWAWVRGDRISSRVTAYYSRYRGSRTEGAPDDLPPAGSGTVSRISASGARASLTLRGEKSGFRAGVGLERGPVELRGSEQGGYTQGSASGTYVHATAFVEAERWIGPLRLAPGVRVGMERRSAHRFVEPRLSLRWQMSRVAISASLDRRYQFLSVLRDAHSLVPGPRMWFLHDQKQSASAADGASLSVDAWKGSEWTATVAGWVRRFRGVPHWRPVHSRNLSELEFHDGSAHGVDATLQKHGGRLRGWVSYQWAVAKYSDRNSDEYYPRWDRRHEAEAVLAVDVSDDLTASLRGTVGSGGPFWFPAGGFSALRFDPRGAGTPAHWAGSDAITIWSNAQGRLPAYARYDVSIRYSMRWGSWAIVPYLSVVNVTSRENVLYYEFLGYRNQSDEASGRGDPWYQQQLPIIPFVGIDFRF